MKYEKHSLDLANAVVKDQEGMIRYLRWVIVHLRKDIAELRKSIAALKK